MIAGVKHMPRGLVGLALAAVLVVMGACNLGDAESDPDMAAEDDGVFDPEFVSEGDRELSVVCWNAWLYPDSVSFIPFPEDQAVRAAQMPAKLLESEADVLALQEIFHDEIRTETLLPELRETYPHVSTIVGANADTPLNGGVIVLSKYPIEAEDEAVFEATRFPFNQASMGTLYVRIVKGDQPYNIFVTHMAGLNDEFADLRVLQRDEMHAFVESQALPDTEAVLLVGDFNADYYAAEYDAMLESLVVDHPAIVDMPTDKPRIRQPDDNDPLTWDSANNRYADDGMRQWIDYGLFRTDHLVPSSNSAMKAKRFRALLTDTDTTLTDLSDHHPVYIKYVLDQ